MNDIAIKIENVSKEYRLGAIGGGTLKGDIQSFMAKIKGKEDPNSQIGSTNYVKNERFLALQGVSFEVHKGEAVGIIGHNGAGKSTLLKLLSRVTAPSSGKISYDGRIASMLEVGTGFHPELTGRENVYMNGAILGMSKAEISRKFDEIVDFAEMRQFIDTPVKRYSSGMYVKLAFSVAAHLDSEIMIMDEVLAVGDMKFQQKCLAKMREVASSGRTVLYVSHNMNTIRRLCDRCIVLSKGQVIFDGDVEKAISIYNDDLRNLDVEYDYSILDRSPNESRALEMLSLTIEDRAESSYDKTEDIKFTLHCRANDDVKNVRFRMEVIYSGGGIVGTTFSRDVFSATKGELLDIDFSMSAKNYAPGIYGGALLAFETGDVGNQSVLHKVYPALNFEVHDHSPESINWLHSYWGNVRFDDIITLDIKEISK